ncbi:MAG: hypothetical protein SPJ13_04905 [Bacteroidales bacterium]|nr:hypothetical protein [Bacteroidales bacterium]
MLENSKPCPEHNSVEHKLNSEPSSIEEHVKDILVPSVSPHAETVQEENVSQVNADEKDARLSPVRHEDRNGAKKTVKIVVFYDDNTFAEFRPE